MAEPTNTPGRDTEPADDATDLDACAWCGDTPTRIVRTTHDMGLACATHATEATQYGATSTPLPPNGRRADNADE